MSASFDKAIKLWDGVKGTFVATLRGHVGPVYQVAWSADSRLFVSGSKDSTLKVSDSRRLLPMSRCRPLQKMQQPLFRWCSVVHLRQVSAGILHACCCKALSSLQGPRLSLFCTAQGKRCSALKGGCPCRSGRWPRKS